VEGGKGDKKGVVKKKEKEGGGSKTKEREGGVHFQLFSWRQGRMGWYQAPVVGNLNKRRGRGGNGK